MPPVDLLLKHATFPDGSIASVGVINGHIAWMVADPDPDATAAQTIDLNGDLLCPGLIDGHIHLDKTFLGAEWQPHLVGETVRERIAAEKQAWANLAVPIADRATALVELALRQGSTSIRTHVDIDPEIGLSHLRAILAVRDRYCDQMTIQIVAFPQSGVVSCPGTLDYLEAALQEGADMVGGLDPIGIDGEMDGQLDALFQLAERRGVGIDIHLHDPDQLGIIQLEAIAQRTLALGMQGNVTVSHAYCLGMVSEAELMSTAAKLAAAGVSIMTNAPGDHAFPPILKLRQTGVNVFAGSDNIRDAWSPFGTADMLERAMLIGYRSGFLTDEELQVAFEMTTGAAAQALGLPYNGMQVGAIADFVVVPVRSVPEAVVSHPPRQLVIKRGQVVVQDGKICG